MFRHPAWAVGSYSSGPTAAGTVGTKSTGGFHQADVSPCNQPECGDDGEGEEEDEGDGGDHAPRPRAGAERRGLVQPAHAL